MNDNTEFPLSNKEHLDLLYEKQQYYMKRATEAYVNNKTAHSFYNKILEEIAKEILRRKNGG